jgi:hypothetical protein
VHRAEITGISRRHTIPMEQYMIFQTKSTVRLLAVALLIMACGQASADWAQNANPVIVTVAPKHQSIQVSNPPVFTWPRHSSNPPAYVVEISSAGKIAQTFTVARNWLLPATKLAVGTYTWRVRPSNNATAWSDVRTFFINTTTRDFVVPDDIQLRQKIAAKPHPRSISSTMPIYANWSADLKAQRGSALTRMRAEVDWLIGRLAFPLDSDWPLRSTSVQTVANVAQNASVRSAVFGNGRQLSAAAVLYRLTGEQKYLTEALARADALAALDPQGASSYENQDQGTRVIALGLAKTLDMLGTHVDTNRRALWLSIINQRTTAMYNDLSGSNGRMDQYPFDSHGGTDLMYLALIAALTVGDIPNANTWFDFSYRASVASTSVWSGPEGGFGNGTTYGEYTAEIMLSIWQPLAEITGVNMFDKPWSRGFINFMMQFVPPGSTRHVFGDGHEVKPVLKIAKAFASNYATPETAWYYRNITEEMDALTTLEAVYPLPVSSVAMAAAPANAAIFPSIGWTAMHSNYADSARTSVYFKSSPYGSYNHSHADQNSFVVAKAGKVLLSEAGYSDYYASPLAEAWYRQTKAHNAVTFDGGVGQATTGYTSAGYNKTLAYGGRITAFSTTNALDYAEGDATQTYDGALTKAVRKIWYLRSQDAVVILDSLASPVARKFEWNLHSLAPMTFESATRTVNVTDAGGTQRVCVRPIPTSPDYVLERRTGALPQAGTVEDHAAYVSSAARTTQEFLFLVDVGCKRPNVTLSSGATSRMLSVGSQMIALPR